MRVCSAPGCPNLYPTNQGSRCPTHTQQADRARGTAAQRGYTSKGHRAFRHAVLTRDPICVICLIRESTDADHYPLSRPELVLKGLNPNDPTSGRGLCSLCHKRETAIHQPGGWNTH